MTFIIDKTADIVDVRESGFGCKVRFALFEKCKNGKLFSTARSSFSYLHRGDCARFYSKNSFLFRVSETENQVRYKAGISYLTEHRIVDTNIYIYILI